MKSGEPGPEEQLSAFLSRFPAETVTLTNRCLTKLRRTFPGCNQIVYDYRHSVVVSFSISERGYEAVVAVSVQPDLIQLYFSKDVPDPKGLLKGSGAKVRSVTVKSASELDRGDVHDLVKAAIKHSGAALPPAGSGRMIIQSETKKKKPRKTGRA